MAFGDKDGGRDRSVRSFGCPDEPPAAQLAGTGSPGMLLGGTMAVPLVLELDDQAVAQLQQRLRTALAEVLEDFGAQLANVTARAVKAGFREAIDGFEAEMGLDGVGSEGEATREDAGPGGPAEVWEKPDVPEGQSADK